MIIDIKWWFPWATKTHRPDYLLMRWIRGIWCFSEKLIRHNVFTFEGAILFVIFPRMGWVVFWYLMLLRPHFFGLTKIQTIWHGVSRWEGCGFSGDISWFFMLLLVWGYFLHALVTGSGQSLAYAHMHISLFCKTSPTQIMFMDYRWSILVPYPLYWFFVFRFFWSNASPLDPVHSRSRLILLIHRLWLFRKWMLPR